jgi:hypothetical protein
LRRLQPLLALSLLGWPSVVQAEPDRVALYDQQFNRFYEANRERRTPSGSLAELYSRVRRDQLVGQLRPRAGALLSGAAGLGACAVAKVRSLQAALKLAYRGACAKALGDAAHDLGTQQPLSRRQSVGEHVSNLAGLAGWMVPTVGRYMPAVAAAQLAKTAYDSALDVQEGLSLARGELLAAARDSGIAPPPELFEGYRAELLRILAVHQAGLDRARATIRAHRPLLARARRDYRGERGFFGTASALAAKLWHEEVLHRALAAARAERTEVGLVQRVLDHIAGR